MGLFDKLFKVNESRLSSIKLSSEEAFIAIMFSAIKADERVTREEMQALGEAMSGAWMGWKYIPSNDLQGADYSSATKMAGEGETTKLLVGEGKIKFHETKWEETPLSYRVMQGLTKLPILEYKGAVLSSGPSRLLIHKQRPMK